MHGFPADTKATQQSEILDSMVKILEIVGIPSFSLSGLSANTQTTEIKKRREPSFSFFVLRSVSIVKDASARDVGNMVSTSYISSNGVRISLLAVRGDSASAAL